MLPLIPITALVIQNSVTMNSLMGYQARVSMVRKQVRAAQCTVQVYCELYCAGQGRDGDRSVYPEHPGGAGRGGSLHLHQPVKGGHRHAAREK